MAHANWPPTSSLNRCQRSVDELRYVSKNSAHWDQHLLSRATLLPDDFCHSCNICASFVGYTSTQHSILYFTRMSHFPSFFCFFHRHTFLIYVVSFFRLYLYSFKLLCPFISNIPSSYAYQFPLSPKANSGRRRMSPTELPPFHWHMFSHFSSLSSHFLLE